MNPTESYQRLDGLVVGIALEKFGADASAWWRLSRTEQVDIFAHLEAREQEAKRPRQRGSDPSDAEIARLRERALAHRRSA